MFQLSCVLKPCVNFFVLVWGVLSVPLYKALQFLLFKYNMGYNNKGGGQNKKYQIFFIVHFKVCFLISEKKNIFNTIKRATYWT